MASRKKQQGKLRRAAKAEAEARQSAEAEEEPHEILDEEAKKLACIFAPMTTCPNPHDTIAKHYPTIVTQLLGGEAEDDRLGSGREEPAFANVLHPPNITDAFWTQPREEANGHWLRLTPSLSGSWVFKRPDYEKREVGCGCWHFIDDEIPRTNIPEFVNAFKVVYQRRNPKQWTGGGGRAVAKSSLSTEMMWRHFVTLWKYPDRIRQIVSYCLFAATDSFIRVLHDDSRFYASLASYFLQFSSLQTPTGSTLHWERARNFVASPYYVVELKGYLKKHVFCSCLDCGNVETQVEVQSVEGDEFELLDSVLQRYESIFDEIEEEKYAQCSIDCPLSDSEIDCIASHTMSEETLLNLELSRLYEQLEEAAMLMRNTQAEEYAYLNFALDQLSQQSMLLRLKREEFDVHWHCWPTEVVSWHGCNHSHFADSYLQNDPQLAQLHLNFSRQFIHQCNFVDGDRTLGRALQAAFKALSFDYSIIWTSPMMMQIATSLFLGAGAQECITGNYKASRQCAAFAYCFEQHISSNLRGQDNNLHTSMNWPKINELFYDPDEHTLVSFFRKRIKCSCLDKKYKQVKSVKKLGICYNINCSHPGRKVERCTMKCCSRCRLANYCSRECQVENWGVHKKFCKRDYQLSILNAYR